MRPELIVAGKELRDHVTSKRFLIIFAILLLVSIYSIVSGMDQYNKILDSYKQSQKQEMYVKEVQGLQEQMQEAMTRGDSKDLIDDLQAQLDSLINPWMPSVIIIFNSLGQYLTMIGMVLGVALGFDLITREKEEGSLKSLLSHPIYRDSIINGKTIGAVAVLTASMGAVFLVTIGIMLFFGVVPSLDEFLKIIAYFVLALLFCLVFFAVAMAASTLAKNSSMAVLYAMAVVIILIGLSMFSSQIVSFVVGSAPDYGSSIATTAGVQTVSYDDNAWQSWNDRYQILQKSLDAISPLTNFQDYIAPALVSDTAWSRPFLGAATSSFSNTKTTVRDALGSMWMNVMVMVAEILAAFAVAYVVFLRTDIR